jgi:hypothetical protein
MTTNAYYDRPDGETFVDKPTKPIPNSDTWETMSTNQLLEVRVALQTRAWQFRNNPAVIAPLNTAIARCEALISRKLQDSI